MKINNALDNVLYEYASYEVEAANSFLLSECTETDVRSLIKHLTQNKYVLYNYEKGKFEVANLD